MRTHFEAIGFDMSAALDKYTNHKVVHVARAVPRKYKSGANCVVKFTQKHVKDAKHCTCTITLTINGSDLKAEETTQHMYAALDIAIAHIEQQIYAYVGYDTKHPVRARLRRRFGV